MSGSLRSRAKTAGKAPSVFLDSKKQSFDTCTPMFIAALFTIAKTWKQPKCPSTDEWIKKMWYMYTMEYYSAIKRNEIKLFAATWMDLEMIMLREVRERQIPYNITYVWNLMNITN